MRRHLRLHGIVQFTDDQWIDLARDLIARKPDLAKRTWRQYKAALTYSMDELRKQKTPENPRYVALTHAIALLASEASTGARKRGRQTSARKLKKVAAEDIRELRQYFVANSKAHRWSRLALSYMEVLLLTGMRPSEVAGAEFEWSSHADVTARIVNGKGSNHRGNGLQRTILLSNLESHHIASIQTLLSLTEAEWAPQEPARRLKLLSKYWDRAVRGALGRRRAYPCLYSFRHQFAADAKKAGRSRAEIAALMGHASDATASSHYGRTTSGRGGLKASAVSQEIRTVRRRATGYPGPAQKKPGL